MNTKPNPEMIDDDNPEWTDEMFAQARPAREVLPQLFAPDVAAQMLAPRRGRPRKADAKEQLTLRLSPQVLAWFRATGPGWQGRIDEALKEWVAAH